MLRKGEQYDAMVHDDDDQVQSSMQNIFAAWMIFFSEAEEEREGEMFFNVVLFL